MMEHIEQTAQAIVQHHGAALGLADWSSRPAPSEGEPSALEAAVRLACARMGFDGVDAQVIARAWQRQSERLGRFDPSAWPSEPQDFGLKPWPRTDAFAPCPQALGLYAVLPDAAWIARMAQAGVPTVQLRFKSGDAAHVRREVQTAVAAVQGTGTLLFINDHWQEAIDAGAYGVHLGQEDLQALKPAELEALRSAGVRLGLSTHGYAEMLNADRYGPSYIAMGAVYATTLKRMPTAPQGTGRLQRYAQLMAHYPLVAIGGIDEQRLGAVMATGVGSVAVVRAIVQAADPEATAAAWTRRISELCTVR